MQLEIVSMSVFQAKVVRVRLIPSLTVSEKLSQYPFAKSMFHYGLFDRMYALSGYLCVSF